MAFDPRKLAIAALGMILLQAGWALMDLAMPASHAVTPLPLSANGMPVASAERWEQIGDLALAMAGRVFEPIRLLTTPLRSLIDPARDWGTMFHALLGILWLFVVWGICGGAIARLAVLQEAQMRQPGIGEGVRFALRSAPALILAPLCPLFAMGFCALVGVVFGLLYRLPSGAVIAGAGLILPLTTGLIMTLFAAGLVGGWPLLHAAIASGSDDALDALSRTFSYLNQRLVSYLAAAALALLAGVVGLTLANLLATGVIRMTQWSLSILGDPRSVGAFFQPGELTAGNAAAATHRFWIGVVRLLADSWIHSFFWTAAAFLYLWLREEVDGTPRTVVDPPAAVPPSPADVAIAGSKTSVATEA
jgi:hypothetical protein